MKSEKNIKVQSKTLGQMELRYISFSDMRFFSESLKNLKDDKKFDTQLLHHQLIVPKIDFKKFSKISDNELQKITTDFMKQEEDVFKYFKETAESEFFHNFREAITEYNDRQLKPLQDIFAPIIESRKILENFTHRYSSIIKQTTESAAIAGELIKRSSAIARQFRESQLLIAESLKPAIEQYQATARIVSKILRPQIELWQKWVEKNKILFIGYVKYWKEFENQYKIAEQEAVKILRKYKWFITLSLPRSFVFQAVKIGRRKGNQWGKMNRLFVNYFSANKFANLESLTEGWQPNIIFIPRMKIFRDSVSVLKRLKKPVNPSNFVLPTLIAQIDGVQQEFMKQKGLSFDSKNRKWVDKKGNIIPWKLWFRTQTSNDSLLDLANDVFLNILFQKSQPGKPLETPFTFNRHKIVHGEYLKYGRIDNTIRAFLILDFLANLT